jgi:DNA-binding transcriptional ArsR family regulator
MRDTAEQERADTADPEIPFITNITALAATANPLRRRLLDLLDVDGPATVAALVERTGQTVGNITRHLRVLEQGGLAQEVPEPADNGGERPWRRTAGYRIMTNDLPDDPVSRAVILAAHSVVTQRHAQLAQSWITAREAFPPGWEASGFVTDRWFRLSPAEVAELREEVCGLFERWANRAVPDDGMDRQPVIAFAQALRAAP